jgi:hypothetical protein
MILVFSFASVTQAQNTPPVDQSETIKALVNELNELKARLAKVEAKQGQPAPTPAETAPAPAPSYAAPTQSYEAFKGIKFQGFGELTYHASDLHKAELGQFGNSGGPDGRFTIGDFDLFVTSRINDKTSFLAELVFGQGADQGFDINIERMVLTYSLNDYFKASVGRYHTADNYFNTVFHSGKWLQTTVDRPLVVDFANDGGLLPTQAVGISLTGKIPSGKLGLNWVGEYGSVDTIRPNINDPNESTVDHGKSNGLTAAIYAKPDWLSGLDVGGSFYHQHLTPPSLTFAIDESVFSAHLAYLTPKYEFINEGFVIQHKIVGSNLTFNTPAFYTLFSDNVVGRWRPFVRFDYTNAAVDSPLYLDVGLRYGPAAGVRYDFNSYLSAKAQYTRTYRRLDPTFNVFSSQLAFRF